MNLRERTYLWYISLLRIYVGYEILLQGVDKFRNDFARSDWIRRQIGDLASLDLYPWYKKILMDYVVPHRELCGYLVVGGEILVGGCLLLGLFTRFGALIGLLMMVTYALGPGAARGGVVLAHQVLLIVSLVVFLLANPGRAIGLDGLFFSRSKGLR